MRSAKGVPHVGVGKQGTPRRTLRREISRVRSEQWDTCGFPRTCKRRKECLWMRSGVPLRATSAMIGI